MTSPTITNSKKKRNIFEHVQGAETVMLKYIGLSIEDQRRIRLEAAGHCAICGVHEDEFSRQHAIDHCHTNGHVRGVLCTNCNLGLGNFKDDPELLAKAVAYLEDTKWQS